MKLLNFEGRSVLNSRDVAEMIGKEHKHLMRDIRTYINDMQDSPNLDPRQFFIESTYTSDQNKILPCYLLTKQGCEFVANKLTGKKGNQFTAQYVSLFNSMKEQISNPVEQALKSFPIPRTMGEALRLAADEADQLAKQKPKVDYYDSQMRNPGLMTTTEIAKDFGWSAKKSNDFLHDHHVIYPVGSGKKKKWVIYQKYADKGYTQYEPYDFKKINGQHGIKNNLKWTQRGKKFIYDLLADFDIHPVLEQMDLLGM